MNIINNIKKRTAYAFLFAASSLPGYTLAASEFELWQAQQKQNFQNYQSAQDKKFSKFLKNQWLEFQLFRGMVRDSTPKPMRMPVVPLHESKQANKASNGGSVNPLEFIKPESIKKDTTTPVMPLGSNVQKKHQADMQLQIDFFGGQVTLTHNNPKLAIKLKSRPDASSIAQFWDDLSSTDYQPILDQLQLQKQTLKLNDWGYIQFVQYAAEKLYGNSDSEIQLFSWFVLSHSGYRARVSYNDKQVYLMVSSKTPFFGNAYLTYEGINYYVVSTKGNNQHVDKLYSYDGHTPKGKQDIDLSLYESPLLTQRNEIKQLQFTYQGTSYQIDAQYNRNIADYFKNYPSSELSVYFHAAISKELNASLTPALSELVRGKSELEAVNFLLRFVQTAFEYKTDEQQFGREKYFFLEELFLYDYSDCEDRSVLFAYLVKTILGLDVVGVNYPGHVATAVHFTTKVEGSMYFYNGKKYIVSDPTYINASVGQIMPQMANQKVKIIPL